MQKRYSDANDLPDVSLEEAIGSLRRLARAIQPLEGTIETTSIKSSDMEQESQRGGASQDVAFASFLAAIPDEDKLEFEKGIPLQNLSQAQQQVLIKWLAQGYLRSTILEATSLAERLKSIVSPVSSYKRLDLFNSGVSVFALEGPVGPKNRRGQIGLSHGIHGDFDGGANSFSVPNMGNIASSWITLPPSVGSLNEQERGRQAAYRVRDSIRAAQQSGNFKDKLAPTPEDYLVQNNEKQPISLSVPHTEGVDFLSLHVLTEQINKGNPTLKLVTDTAIKDKKVTRYTFSPAGPTPTEWAEGIAAVYGLMQLEVPVKTLLISPASLRAAHTFAEVPAAAKRVFPDPWFRVLRSRATSFVQTVRAELKKRYPEAASQDIAQSKLRSVQGRAVGEGASTLRDAATHRLRVVVEPVVDKSTNGTVSVSSTESEAQTLLILIVAADALPNIYTLCATPAPPLLTNPERVYIRVRFDSEGDSAVIDVIDAKPNDRPTLSRTIIVHQVKAMLDAQSHTTAPDDK